MKKLFSLLAVAVLGFTACQTDEGVKNATLENEGVVSLNVSIPELATRALDGDNKSGADSAYGAIDYANYTSFLESEYDVRFQLAVYEADAAKDAEPIYTATDYVDFGSTTNFNDLRFVPGRKYQFVLFADFVKQGSQEDFRYNTADLRNITSFEALNAMDETYDAYFFNKTLEVKAGKENLLDADLKRPFGKIRVLTTDLAWVEKYAMPAEGEVTFYNLPIYKSFNAVTGEVATEAANAEETLRYAIDTDYYGATKYEGKEAATLFATYILGKNNQEAVNFRLDTFEADGSLIKSLDFNTQIPYQRNHLTTLVGNLLTNEADLQVRIDDNFDPKEFVKDGAFENPEEGLGYVREGEKYGSYAYQYETNLFYFTVVSDEGGQALPTGEFEYTDDETLKQNEGYFSIEGIDVEKGTLTIENITRAGNTYEVVFDIYATIDGKTENYILTWTGELKAPRTALDTPVVEYEFDEEGTHITFSWEPVEGAKNYTVSYNGEEQTVEGTSATFLFTYELKEGQLVVKQTAYVTANPELSWSNTKSTATVNIEYNVPITWNEVPVFLQYIKGTEVAFAADGLTIYLEKYPTLEGAWYQSANEYPKTFSKEATIEVTTGSAAQVVIADPVIATKFIYTGAMNPYILTEAEVNWVAGYNTVKVKFSNKAGDAIEFQTTAPMEAGKATIEPSYVAIAGQQAANIENAEMNVLLEDGEYTIFFTIESASNDVLMQYVGAIDFEKPYAPQYVLESYTAGAETINFVGKGAEFEIEATSLEEGDVVVKKIILDGSDDYAASNQVTAATAVVKEENGVYDARYTVTVNLPITGAKTFDLQYVGPFVPYSAPAEPQKPIEFTATYEVKGTAYLFTGVNYNFSILVNNLATTEYISSETEDAWAYDWTWGQPMNNFRTGDFLTVENNVVTIEFTADPYGTELRYKMTCDMNPESEGPKERYVNLALENGYYVSENYQIEYTERTRTAVVYVKNQAAPINMIDKVTITEDNHKLVFEFIDIFNNLDVTATYTKPVTDIEVDLALEGEIYKGEYENTTYSLTSLNNGKATLQIDYADGTSAKGLFVDFTEDEQGITFTFDDEKNNVNVTATYKKADAPVKPDYDLELTVLKASLQETYGNIFYAYVDANDTNDNYVQFTVNTAESTATSINAGTYTYNGMSNPDNNAGEFKLNAYKANGTRKTGVPATMVVEKNGNYYDITFTAGEFVAHYEGVFGEEQPVTPPTQDWTNLSETAELGKVGVFPAYVSDNYHIIGETWTERANDKNYGTCEIVETANGYIFTFDDDKNFRHVTITYTEESTEGPVTIDPWACTASNVSGSPLTGYSVTLTGENGDIIVLTGVKFNAWGASSATLNGNAVEFTGNGAMIDTNNGGYVKVDITIGNTTYKGTSKNAVA